MAKRVGGVNLAKVISKEVGAQLKGTEFAMTLTKVTPGTRTTGALTSGTNPTTTAHTAKGFIDDYRTGQVDGELVKVRDRRITLLGASISPAAVPEPGDRITAEGVAYTIVRVMRDPADATYECQARGRGGG